MAQFCFGKFFSTCKKVRSVHSPNSPQKKANNLENSSAFEFFFLMQMLEKNKKYFLNFSSNKRRTTVPFQLCLLKGDQGQSRRRRKELP